MAVHILAFLEHFKTQRVTSDFIAGSVGTNPVVIRRILGLLKAASLVTSQQGSEGGFSLGKRPRDISLLEIYQAVKAADAGNLFSLHEHSHPQCPVGGVIQGVLEHEFLDVQTAMEAALQDIKLNTVMRGIKRAHQSAPS
jgi:DNA-binding IscR family transcriptional regulator